MSFIIRLLVNAVALFLISHYNWFGIHADSITDTLIGAVVLGVVNAVLRPILMLLTCPLVIVTLGLFTLVINALCFWFVLKILPGWHIPGFWSAFMGALVVTVVSWIGSLLFRDVPEERKRFSR
jgi:putative membrane protein